MKNKSILAVLIAASLLFTAVLPGPSMRASDEYATQEQRDELAELQRQEANLAAQQAGLDSQMSTIRNEVYSLQQQSGELNSQLDNLLAEGKILQSEYDTLMAQLAAAKQAMDDAIAAYDEARKEVDDKQVEYENRLVAMYKNSKQSPLEVLLDSDGITGFFTNLELLSVIGRSDQQILEELTAARETAQVKKQVAEESKKQYEQFVADKQAEIDVLSGKVDTTENDIAYLQNQIINRNGDLSSLESQYYNNQSQQGQLADRQNQLENQIAAQAEATQAARAEATRAAQAEATRAAAAEAARVAAAEATRAAAEEAARVAAAEATRAAQAASGSGNQSTQGSGTQAPAAPAVPSSGFVFPAPGNTSISSGYGWRPYPLNPSYSDFHDALDFPGYFGDPVVASASGTVIRVEYPLPGANYGLYGYGYANMIMIQHENGFQTVYGHLKTINVSVGQYVAQGERIGTIGSTGSSTGPHLHFELRRPGYSSNARNTVNPYPYLFG